MCPEVSEAEEAVEQLSKMSGFFKGFPNDICVLKQKEQGGVKEKTGRGLRTVGYSKRQMRSKLLQQSEELVQLERTDAAYRKIFRKYISLQNLMLDRLFERSVPGETESLSLPEIVPNKSLVS